MIYTDLTKKALRLCFEAHKNQTDKGGMPYVFHPFHIAERMDTEEKVIVALLHDVVEDTNYTVESIRDMGFSDDIVDALKLMTHDKHIPYMEYIKKICENPISKAVKLADLEHNSDMTRLDVITERDKKRIETYLKAMEFLK